MNFLFLVQQSTPKIEESLSYALREVLGNELLKWISTSWQSIVLECQDLVSNTRVHSIKLMASKTGCHQSIPLEYCKCFLEVGSLFCSNHFFDHTSNLPLTAWCCHWSFALFHLWEMFSAILLTISLPDLCKWSFDKLSILTSLSGAPCLSLTNRVFDPPDVCVSI